MPNWCMNRATFAGDEAAIDRLVAGARYAREREVV